MTISPHFRRPALFVALAATAALAAGAVFADPQARHEKMHGEQFGEHFAALDTNGDGAVSRQEFDAMRDGHLAQADANRDGLVSYEEHKGAREAQDREQYLKRHDKDGDGRVSIGELSAKGEGHFERMDRNDDGVISKDEMGSGKRRMERIQKDD